jgi:hypothetical protein
MPKRQNIYSTRYLNQKAKLRIYKQFKTIIGEHNFSFSQEQEIWININPIHEISSVINSNYIYPKPALYKIMSVSDYKMQANDRIIYQEMELKILKVTNLLQNKLVLIIAKEVKNAE